MTDRSDRGFREPITEWEGGVERSRVLHGPNEYFHNYFRTLRTLDRCLEKWLEVPLIYDEQEKAASLIYDLTAPTFELKSKQVDSASLKASIQGIDDALAGLGCARRALASLPSPLNDRTLGSHHDIDKQMHNLTGVREELFAMLEEHSQRSNQRAVRVAKVLRASFERYTCKKPTSSAIKGTVTSEFCQALEEVYGIIGMTANAFNYAKIALGCPAEDPELLQIKEALRQRFDEEADYMLDFCEITRTYSEPIG